jgi:ABC-type multidrug transport system fused ATPase/permease subunit
MNLCTLSRYVGQEPVLFKGSIGFNIALGKAHTSDESMVQMKTDEPKNHFQYSKVVDDIEQSMESSSSDDVINAAMMSNAHNFITNFSQGYDTDVGEGSVLVSGGQKQRIAIARALIRNPAVLLFDEATSALDAASEMMVQESIDRIQQSKSQTIIMIAHRLSTVIKADKIIVVENGTIVEMGTHEELLRKEALYAHLWSQQTDNSN